MLKKSIILITLVITGRFVYAETNGLYVGGGAGYGSQELSAYGSSTSLSSIALRAIIGYQLFSFIGAEVGYTYINPASNWNNLGAPSSTIYDIAILPGLPIPLTPVTFYGRFGIDAVSANLNTQWSDQIISKMTNNIEWGYGVKVDIPFTSVFLKAEYINFGNVTNNSNSNVNVKPSVAILEAGYVF